MPDRADENSLGVNDATLIVLAVAVAALARALVVVNTPPSAPLSDMAEYWTRGEYLFTHGALYPDSWRMPGLPAWLATAFLVSGRATIGVADLGNVAAGCIASALAYLVARRCGSRARALVAALLVALYPSLLLYSRLVATETLVAVPVLAAFLAITYSGLASAVALGVSIGLAILVRPASVALLPAAIAVVAFLPRRKASVGRAKCLAMLCASLALTLIPWWTHNYSLHGRFVPLDTTGGLNLLIGSGPGASGRWDWAHVSSLQATLLAGVDVTTPDGSSRASQLALASIREAPGRWLALAPQKLSGLFALDGRETTYLYSLGYFGDHSATTVASWAIASVLAFPLVVAVGSAALAGGAVRRDIALAATAFLLSTAMMHVVTFGDPRFHLPLVPVLAVLASQARVRQWRGWVIAFVFCAMIAPSWYSQAVNYSSFVRRLMAPGGWQSPVSFDDLL